MALFFMTVCSNFDFDVIYINFAKAFDTLLFLILNYLQFYRLFLWLPVISSHGDFVTVISPQSEG